MSHLIGICTCLLSSLCIRNMIQLDKTIIRIFADVNFVVWFLALKELKEHLQLLAMTAKPLGGNYCCSQHICGSSLNLCENSEDLIMLHRAAGWGES